ncbi:MAG: hypothetical protein IJZ13_00200 [Clostridia bacterium]|nr:hypothetical protein [Clostridia bacterium]
MKQKVTKILCWVLLMVLICGIAGCTGDPAPESKEESSETADTTTTTAESTTTSSETADTTTTVTESTTGASEATTTAPTTAGTTKATTKATTQTTTKVTTQAPTTTTTTKRQPLLSDNKVSDIGSGFYCVNFDKYGFDTKWKELAQSDYVNTVFCDSTKFLRDLTDYNCKVWVGVHDIYNKVVAGTAGWQDSFDSKYQSIKDSGYEDTVLGWYLDEPGNMAAVKELSRYAEQAYGKRFFVCYTVQATDYTVYGGYNDYNSHINKDNVRYLTDIAVDHYWEVTDANKAGYEKLYGTLHEMMPEDCKVWYIPNTFAGWTIVDKTDAEIAEAARIRVEHIQYMYEWLKKEPEENRGGILFFSYDFNSSAEELYGLWNINDLTGGKWNNVLAECIRVGREICTGKLD